MGSEMCIRDRDTLSGTDAEELDAASAEAEGADGSTPSSGKSSATSVATEVAVAAEKWLKGQRSN